VVPVPDAGHHPVRPLLPPGHGLVRPPAPPFADAIDRPVRSARGHGFGHRGRDDRNWNGYRGDYEHRGDYGHRNDDGQRSDHGHRGWR
jgi:hypothetical protein